MLLSLLRKHSTAQRSQPAQAAKQVRSDQSATTQASRQSWLEQACRRAFIQLAVFSEQTKKSKSARPTAGVMLPVRLYTAHSLRSRFYFVDACGVRVAFVDHGALGICKSPVCTEPWTSLSASFARIWFIILFKKKNFLVSELSGRRKTPAQRSALDNIGFFNFL